MSNPILAAQVLSELKANGVDIFQMVELPPPAANAKKGAPPVTPGRDAEPDATSYTPRTAATPAPSSQVGKDGFQVPQRPQSTTQPPPFAVCASEDGTRVYTWGTCCVEEPSHSDLSLLRSMLFASSMLTAKRTTVRTHSERLG